MPQDNALHKAASKGDLEECKKWIECPPEGEDKIEINELGANERTALHRAAGGGFLEVMEYLCTAGADIHKPDKSGRTPLHWAAIAGHVEVMQALIAKGALIDVATSSGMNVLHAGCEAQKVEVVRFVMEHLKENEEMKLKIVNMKNSDGKIPFELAVATANQATCTLLKEGGDPNAASASCILM